MSNRPAVTMPGAADVAADASPSTYLRPTDDFPDLQGLPLTAVLALHGRVCRQIDREYLDLVGPSVETLDRHRELSEELDRRERRLVKGAAP